MSSNITVLKFGGSVLSGAGALPGVAEEILRESRRGRRVLVVVSAFAGVTDALDALSRRFVGPEDRHVARLLATGEATSSALLAMQLKEIRVSNAVLDPRELGLYTTGPRLDASPVSVDVDRLIDRLNEVDAVIVGGFVACGKDGALTLLGRGGSDLSAVFLAHQLDARECRLIKDVPGVFPADPKLASTLAYPYAELSFERALEIAGVVVQAKAVRYARRHGRAFRVCGANAPHGTLVGPFEDRLITKDDARSRAIGLTGPDIAEFPA